LSAEKISTGYDIYLSSLVHLRLSGFTCEFRLFPEHPTVLLKIAAQIAETQCDPFRNP